MAGMLLVLGLLAGCGEDVQPAKPAESLAVEVRLRAWQTPFGPGQELITPHYRIYTTAPSELTDILPGFLEAACRNYERLTRIPASATSMAVYLLASRMQWSHLTESVFGRDAAPAVLLENGGYTHNGITVCWDIGGGTTLAVASHEGMHQYLYYHVKSRLPLWAEESLATACEGFVLQNRTVRFTPNENLMRKTDLREGILGGHWLTIDLLLSSDTLTRLRTSQEKGISYYGQLYALGHFLRNSPTYSPKWQAMLRDAQTGRMGESLPAQTQRLRSAAARALFEHYVTADLPAFEREFRAYARRLAGLPA